MEYVNGRKKYEVRISCYEDSNGKAFANISFGDGVMRKIGAPYITLHRVDDKLVFVPHQEKKYGRIRVNNSKAQFGKDDDVITLLDFVGEYPLKRADNGMPYVDLADRTGYTEIHSSVKGFTKNGTTPVENEKVAENPTVVENAPASLAEMLEAAISDTQDALQEVSDRLVEAKAAYEHILEEQAEWLSKLEVYRSALKLAKGEK